MRKYVVTVEAVTKNILTQEITVLAESKADAIRLVSNTEEFDENILDVDFISDNILSTEQETILSVEPLEEDSGASDIS